MHVPVWKEEKNLWYLSSGIVLWVFALKYWSLGIGPQLLFLKYWSLGIGPQVLVFGCWSSGIDWSLDIGPQELFLEYWSLGVDHRELFLEYWSSGFGLWVLGLGYRFSICTLFDTGLFFGVLLHKFANYPQAFGEFCLCLPSYHRNPG